jgi:hypothetical protein
VVVLDSEGVPVIENCEVVKTVILPSVIIDFIMVYYGEFPRWNSSLPNEFTPNIPNNNNNHTTYDAKMEYPMYLFYGDQLMVDRVQGSVKWNQNVHLLDRPLDTYSDCFCLEMQPHCTSLNNTLWFQSFLIGPCDDYSELSIVWKKTNGIGVGHLSIDSSRRCVTIQSPRIPVSIILYFIREDQTRFNSDRDNLTYTIIVECKNPNAKLRWNSVYRRDAILHHQTASAVTMKIKAAPYPDPDTLYRINLAVTASSFETPLTPNE